VPGFDREPFTFPKPLDLGTLRRIDARIFVASPDALRRIGSLQYPFRTSQKLSPTYFDHGEQRSCERLLSTEAV